MPFYPTPDRDDGYDITDFYGVDPRLGHARRLRRADPHRARPRDAGHRRPRREPHLRPAPVVPVGPVEPDVAVPRLVRLARRPAAGHRPRTSSSPTRRRASGSTTRRPASTTCTASTSTSPTSTSPTRGARRDRQGHGLLARARRVRLPGRRRAVPARDRPASTRAERRSPDPHDYLRDAAGVPRPPRRATAILLGEVNLPHEDQAHVLRRRRTATS